MEQHQHHEKNETKPKGKSLSQMVKEIEAREQQEAKEKKMATGAMDDVISVSSRSTGHSSTCSRGSKRTRMVSRSHQDLIDSERRQMPSFEIQRRTDTIRMAPNESQRVTKGTNVLSWDCGITNLCYCLLEELEGEAEFRIIMWENFSLASPNLREATKVLAKAIKDKKWMKYVDYVCIETQVMRNVQMKTVSHVIQGIFEYISIEMAMANSVTSFTPSGIKIARMGKGGPQVHFVKPESKFKVAGDIVIPERFEKLKQRHRRNKLAAIHIAQEILRRKQYFESLNYLNSLVKKDDLADSFLQGLYFLRTIKKKKEQKQKLKDILGISHKKQDIVINIFDETTGTRKERYDDGDGMNEGCEYDKEVAIPQLYKCKSFVFPVFEKVADVALVKRYKRRGAKMSLASSMKHEEKDSITILSSSEKRKKTA